MVNPNYNPNSSRGYLSPKEQKQLKDIHNAEKWLYTFFAFIVGALLVLVGYNL